MTTIEIYEAANNLTYDEFLKLYVGDGLTNEVKECINLVSEVDGVSFNDIKGGRSLARIVAARHALFHVLKTRTSMTFEEIGFVTGNRHHATVINGINNVALCEEKYNPRLFKYNKLFK
jgi:chromosomal replication initiation ATPase DnaA